ncbi:hypothetical protein LAV84_30180 [Rhizobium sp. VS19-DR104.2]|uniref:hypothetical protein n=1 Tax=unclassified Rhizobium TaxID=2613769 RepID=UPI001C5A9A0D|nr:MULTISPECIES: hypothetical protein [unclassified Rhizobium]MBZ5763720.1 hypothetical protein [Rhizobium sp. VS19-DR96]MBZ5769653.1 hypothetical protein [Rhizobium sp. VS19-DR129.2]MBZ5777188.1 hypothetical protein [Rhizobium sp. VS19-DRK62.2]MBZ5788334.1 hypothetical protein [Rhizobium sp. VS19-DR121]MBZ5805787.1 hypothetical protein [Rhizobium sp. VS19-DR181]
MTRYVIAFTAAAALVAIAAVPAFSQVVIYDRQAADPYSVDGNTESNFLRSWNRHHDHQNRWSGQQSNFGPDDVITLLEDRGYRVKDVQDVGERYLVKATRGGDNLLVSVSRSGDIMGVVHDQYQR